MQGYAPYNMAKEAVRALTRSAAREWGADKITVNNAGRWPNHRQRTLTVTSNLPTYAQPKPQDMSWRVLWFFQAMFTDATGSRVAARAARKARTAATPSNAALNSKVVR